MDTDALRALFDSVKAGGTTVEAALTELKHLPFRDLGFATVDHHRALRTGAPEVIFGEGKTSDQILRITQALIDAGENVLVTRIDEAKSNAFVAKHPHARMNAMARTAAIEVKPVSVRAEFSIALVTAGTSDLFVAEECAETLRLLGIAVDRVNDVGVAGIHRLLDRQELLRSASAIIVIAGMEGALASVIGGLVDKPVIAVPTSVGYGAALSGFTPLMGMLTSCASGVTVCNIDNGFGAAFAALRLANAFAALKGR